MNIVERIRADYYPARPEDPEEFTLLREAADEIERERKAHMELAASYHDSTNEIERLREYIALKDGWATPGIYNFKTDLGKALAENAKLREALEDIVCVDYKERQKIARAALSAGEGIMTKYDASGQIVKARNQALEEAAKFVEENYEEPMINIVGNPSWRERGPKKLAAAIRALKG